ncbi:chromosome segregation protein SMC [Geomonas terrae]|uniref:Chromosome segregation protein SMC n=1 Tax=Geomonas terrae TaxID=2562681 RepID=A0A4S1C9K0_9BACT|nr:AAA family ATPase [Geomonas terrae]TGU69929.1 chromosome segregation protein SMC [Geomonas terrae]
MRLDKITIGSEKDSPAHQFKNLKNVTIDFDQDHWVTVVIGWNGTGKSNVLEALAIIFRELISSKKPKIDFAFKLAYRMGAGGTTRHIHIDADPDRDKDPFIIHVATNKEAQGKGAEEGVSALRGKRIRLSTFVAEDEINLPRYVFSYYSGESTRMYEVFRPYLENFDSKLRKGIDPGLKRLFYAMPVHSQFVLLAFLIQQSDVVREFLDEHLGLDADEGIESVLFVLREPPWKSKDGDPRFWNARGVVSNFLAKLYDIALAPIKVSRNVATSIWNKEKLEFKYLYVKDIQALRMLVGDQTPAQFFRDLESTYVSELFEEVRIRVRLKKNDGSVTFRELSEGEQQLLTVLGLMCFTAEKESLFLLDEPDTHLNPKWCVDYFGYLQKFAGSDATNRETSHILLTTHNPLAIAELVKEQVQILQLKHGDDKRCIVATHPDMDPRGQGYAAIVTSDMFGIASSLDKSTQELLERQRLYAGKSKLSEEELRSLDEINTKLERLGFRFFLPDDEYSRYLRIRFQVLEAKFGADNAEVTAKVLAMSRIEREELASELIDALVKDEDNEPKGQK